MRKSKSKSDHKEPYHFRTRPSNFGKNAIASLRFRKKRTRSDAKFFEAAIEGLIGQSKRDWENKLSTLPLQALPSSAGTVRTTIFKKIWRFLTTRTQNKPKEPGIYEECMESLARMQENIKKHSKSSLPEGTVLPGTPRHDSYFAKPLPELPQSLIDPEDVKYMVIPDEDTLWNQFLDRKVLYQDIPDSEDLTFQKFKEIYPTLQKRY